MILNIIQQSMIHRLNNIFIYNPFEITEIKNHTGVGSNTAQYADLELVCMPVEMLALPFMIRKVVRGVKRECFDYLNRFTQRLFHLLPKSYNITCFLP